MEIEYHKKKIKNELLDLDFSAWTKESIITLVSVFQYSQCKELYTISLMILDDYLKWYKNNKDYYSSKQYSLEKLIDLQKLIKDDLFHNQHYNYESYLDEELKMKNPMENSNKDYNYEEYSLYNDYGFYTLFIGIFLVMYIIFGNLSWCFSSRKVEIAKSDNELKLPLPEDLVSNPLIKLLLQKVF
jgi:hypothetical protein